MKPEDLPESLSPLRDLDWSPINIGESSASVWRIALGDGNAAFLKSEPLHPLAELPGEIERLNWLTHMGFKAPRVVDAEQGHERLWLLMSAVPGEDLTHYLDQPDVFVHVYAQGLKRLHALDTTTCPFDHGIEARLAAAESRVEAGLVDETDFDDARSGWTARQVLDWLKVNRPQTGQQIVTHGDASTPNILAFDRRFSGMVDCGRIGLADVWQDLALACRSIEFNIGRDHIAPFLSAYGAEWDEAKYLYYCTLDELF
ncbi:APH(3') family aminoglycoside O-phosphotransferase [uncultured Devosia sp.]|uniref:APH(3') family aminoglycoside O-phosphotransferase n=1 Tax=uncultured Devosia sp. TaxID=211434 RepID=UPI00260FCE34|nr:APH(3') family aminoglycoside O-phosphotransferase [uncultured Devosia sp.]